MKVLVDGVWLTMAGVTAPMDALYLRDELEAMRRLGQREEQSEPPALTDRDIQILSGLLAEATVELPVQRQLVINNGRCGYQLRRRLRSK